MSSITETHFQFPGQVDFYRGKVRDVYIFEKHLVVIASDRISAFDVVLPQPIPYKGQVLNQTSLFFMEATKAEVPNWVTASPDPNVTVGLRCEPIPLEMVVRAYLAGSAWRAYRTGKRNFNGYILPEGLKENDPLPEIIITPATKAEKGQHDEDINTDEILQKRIVNLEIYEQLETYTRILFRRGSEIADKNGLILIDTKYEFGLWDGQVYLIDEIHTPDSSRYFDKAGYAERQAAGMRQTHRSKEMVRQWLIENGFQGNSKEQIPQMSEEWIQAISHEYIALYEQLTGKAFERVENSQRLETLEQRIKAHLLL